MRIFEALFKVVSTRLPLKPQSKIHIASFVHPSKIFVWGAYPDFDRYERARNGTSGKTGEMGPTGHTWLVRRNWTTRSVASQKVALSALGKRRMKKRR
jgi:hypothetical protein